MPDKTGQKMLKQPVFNKLSFTFFLTNAKLRRLTTADAVKIDYLA